MGRLLKTYPLYFLYEQKPSAKTASTANTMKRSSVAEQYCPVGRAAGQLLDAWTFVIVRELFLGNRRFEALRLHTGMSPRSLTLRLAHLLEQGILEKQARADTPTVHEYRLTAKGLDLWPVLMTMRQWGERWAGPWGRSGTPLKLLHKGHDHALHAALVCAECGEPVDARSGQMLPTARALREREAFAAAVHESTAKKPP
jgi:DNA-binding HxlR family transcriptional regulator